MLLLALLTGCNNHGDIPVGGTVAEGTLIGIEPVGETSSDIAVTYRTAAGRVSIDLYDVGHDGDEPRLPSELLILKEPLYPGNRFKIVKSEPLKVGNATLDTYTASKVE